MKFNKIALSVCFLLLSAYSAWSAPPSIEIPSQLKPTGQYVDYKPKTDAVSITYVGLSGVDGFPSGVLKDPNHFFLPIAGMKDGEYKFAAVASSATGEQKRVDFSVIVGKGGVVEPLPMPNPDASKPPPDIAPKPTVYYMMIVRPDGPASKEFTKIMEMSAWGELRKLGHTVKDRTLTEALSLGLPIPQGTTIPAVWLLEEVGTKSTVKAGPVSLPSTAEGILALPKTVK